MEARDTIPLSGYGDGEKWDDSKYQPDYGSCVAFAMFVYDQLWNGSKGKKITTQKIQDIPWGSWVQTTGPYGRHDMIIGSNWGTKVYVYDVNWIDFGSGSPYTVDYRSYTADEFNKTFKIFGGYLAP